MKKVLFIFLMIPYVSFGQWTTSGTNIYTTNAGFVGIGTTTPTTHLHLSKANTGTLLLIENTSSTVVNNPGLTVANYQGAVLGNPVITLSNSKGTKAAPTALGGTLIGAITFAGYNSAQFISSVRIDALSEATYTTTSTPSYLTFSTTSSGAIVPTERLRINSAGNVGIGTSTPGSYRLAVAGKIAATGEVRVFNIGTTIFPDYVFEPEYKLPSLAEIETYIKANKHLPEVPSAGEVALNGMSLSEMNIILLKKIEELTLHLIEMKKQVDELMK